MKLVALLLIYRYIVYNVSKEKNQGVFMELCICSR